MCTVVKSCNKLISSSVSDLVKIRDRQLQNTENLRENLFTFYGHVGIEGVQEAVFVKGDQNAATEALVHLLDNLGDQNNQIGNFKVQITRKCNDCQTIISDQTTEGIMHDFTPKPSTEQMVKFTRQEQIQDLNCAGCNKSDIRVTEETKLTEAKEFFVFTGEHGAGHEQVQTYPTEVLTINGQDYIIRGVINHHGVDRKSGHYTCSIFSQNRWFLVDDFHISEMKGSNPYPTSGLVYFYEKRGENEPVPFPVKDAAFLPPQLRTTRRAKSAPKPKQFTDLGDPENDVEENIRIMREIRKTGIDNLNNDVSNKSNLTTQNPALKHGVRLFQRLKDEYVRSDPCLVCKNSWFNFHVSEKSNMCHRCENLAKKGLYTWGEANGMVPGTIPECLKILTYVEECAIKLAQPVSHIYCRRGGKTSNVFHKTEQLFKKCLHYR